MALALEVDVIKHSLGQWDGDPVASGLHARRLALALVREQFDPGYDVVIAQYLAATAFVVQIEPHSSTRDFSNSSLNCPPLPSPIVSPIDRGPRHVQSTSSTTV